MYYFYSPEMFAPYQWGLERDVSYAYMPCNSFYYGEYISALPYAYIPQSYEVQIKVDEPDLEFTPKILDKLKQHNVKATFFLLGENAEKFPNVVKRIANEGHIIGNHTFSHPNLAKVNDAEYRNQIIKTEEILNRLAGYAPKFIRPPYGEILENQLKWATEQNFMIVQWSVDTVDWKGVSADTITNNVLGNSFPGSIILQHSTPGGHLQGSVEALDKMIPQLKTKGARFVTLPSMFQTSKERK